MELPKLQYVSHELGLSSHGTRSQILERLDAHLSEEGRYLDVPLNEAVDRLYLKLVRGLLLSASIGLRLLPSPSSASASFHLLVCTVTHLSSPPVSYAGARQPRRGGLHRDPPV